MKGPRTGSATGLRRPRLLVVVDDPQRAALVEEALDQAGFRTATLTSPVDAARTLNRQRYAAVVIDLQSTALEGERLVELFRGTPHLSTLPIVLLWEGSPSTMPEEVRQLQGVEVIRRERLAEELGPAALRVAVPPRTRHDTG